MTRKIAFVRIASLALIHSEAICARWLPDGCRQGAEWVARNPNRTDRNSGSFKVNLRTGLWADFATGDFGGDLISLAAYLFDLRQSEAAKRLCEMLRIDPYE